MEIHGQPLLSSHHWLLPAVILFGTFVMVWHLRREPVPPARVVLMQVSLGISGLFGAKLFSLYLRGWEMWTPAVLEWQIGWRYPGALIALVASTPILRRWIIPGISTLRYLDAVVLIFGLEAALWRINCHLNGCCVGGLCNEFYCLAYAPGTPLYDAQLKLDLIAATASQSLAVVPLHLYLMAASFVTVGFLFWFDRFKQYDGQIVLLYLFIHEGLKGALESLRAPHLHHLQLISFGVSALALAALIAVGYGRMGGKAEQSRHAV